MGPPERRLQISPNRATPQIAGDKHDDVSGNHRLRRPFWHCSLLPPAKIMELPAGPLADPGAMAHSCIVFQESEADMKGNIGVAIFSIRNIVRAASPGSEILVL